MKRLTRLSLDAFKAQKNTSKQQVDQLLGQVLGNCHNSHSSSGGGGEGTSQTDRSN